MNTVLGARKQRRLIISRTALLNMELKIQGSVDCPLKSLCQLLMLLRHTDHSKQIMETFTLRMPTLSRENESIAQLCRASVTTASHSWRACTVGKSNHVCPSLKLTRTKPPPPKKNRNNVHLERILSSNLKSTHVHGPPRGTVKSENISPVTHFIRKENCPP